MNTGIVATRYAKALLEFARDNKKGEEVYYAMKVLAFSFAQLPSLRRTVNDVILPAAQRCSLLMSASSDKEKTAPLLLESFFLLVIKHNREDLFHSISLQYVDLYRKAHKIVYGILTTATSVDETVISRIEQILISGGERVELEVKCDPSVIGGFVLETDMQIMDASISTQLRNMRKMLVSTH